MRSDPGFPSRIDPVGYVSPGAGAGSSGRFFLSCLGWGGTAGPEAEAVVSGLQDVAVVCEAIEQRGSHLGIAEHSGPLEEAQVGNDDDTGALGELAEQVEQERTAR